MSRPDIRDGLWTLKTAEREKGNPGPLRLPEMALEVVRSQPRRTDTDYVFPGVEGGRYNNFRRRSRSSTG